MELEDLNRERSLAELSDGSNSLNHGWLMIRNQIMRVSYWKKKKWLMEPNTFYARDVTRFC